jgi:hypothetical protein
MFYFSIAFLSANEFLYPALELGAREQHFMVAPNAAHPDVRTHAYHPPVVASAGVRLAQRVYVSNADVQRLYGHYSPV